MSDPDGPWHDRGAPTDDELPRRTLPEIVGELVWRYRAAPLATRVTVDLIAVACTLAIVAAATFLLLRDPGGPDLASASAGRGTTTWTAPSTTVRPTTTAAPTTTAPTTTTTEPPTTTDPPTTATAPPPPPTTAPPPPPSAPPTTAEPHYRSCAEAAAAGALPLYRGEPGYDRWLDRDHDGEACEWGDGF